MNLSLKSVNYVTYVFQYYNVLLPWYMLRKRWYMVLFNVLRKRMSKKNNTPENMHCLVCVYTLFVNNIKKKMTSLLFLLIPQTKTN